MTTSNDMATDGGALQQRAGGHPAWGVWGGVAVTIGAVLLLVATLLEGPLWQAETFDHGLLAVFSALFLGSTVAHAIAMIPLSGGRTGADGIVGSSVMGRVALLGFGAIFLASQTLYYAVTYALPPVDDYSGLYRVDLCGP